MFPASVFVFDIIDDVLKLGVTSNEYAEIEGVQGGRNIFYYCIIRNHRYLNPNCAFALKSILSKKAKNDRIVKTRLYNYFENYLSDKVKQYIESNPDNLEQIIDLAISEFTNPNEKACSKNINESSIKNIAELYIKIARYLNEDIETAFILLNQLNSQIIKYIADEKKVKFTNTKEGIEKVLITLYTCKKILPNDVFSYITYLKNLDKVDNIHSKEDFVKMIFLSIKYVLKWFLKYFLKKPEFFTKIYCKAWESFKKEEDSEEIKIYTINDLEKEGWTLESFAKAMLKIFYETIGEDFENVTGIYELIKNIQYQRETHRVMLNKDGEVIGCWAFGPVKQELFEKDKRGELLVSEVNPLTMPTMIPGKVYNIHFGAICLRDNYRKTHVFTKLFYSIMNEIEKLAINGIFIDEIVTKACSDSGINLAESIGLRYLIDHKSGDGKIYFAKMEELLNNLYLKHFTILKSLYRNRETH